MLIFIVVVIFVLAVIINHVLTFLTLSKVNDKKKALNHRVKESLKYNI